MDFKFFSPFVSYAQRLPNGNMGRIFEITNKYELVWGYMYPYGSDTQNIPYRSYLVGYDWMPEADQAEEVAVLPPDNNLFYLPNIKGEYSNTGIEGEPVRAELSKEAAAKAEELEGGPTFMHSY